MNSPQLPRGWQMVNLETVLHTPLVNGRSVATRDGGFPVLRLTAIKSDGIDLSEHKDGDWTEEQAEPFLVKKDDFLVSRGSGSIDFVGRGALVPELSLKVAFPDTMIRVRARPDLVYNEYLKWVWDSPVVRDQIKKAARTTSGIYKVNQRTLGEIRFPLPPLEEQRIIAGALDGVDDLRVKRRKTLKLLDELTRSIFLEMFGDPVTNGHGWRNLPLTEACHCYSGGTPSKADPANWSGTIPWFSAKDMKLPELFASRDTVDESLFQRTPLKLLPRDTVAIVVRGMILAHTLPVCILRVPSAINQDLKALLPRVELRPEYLATCIRVQAKSVLARVSTAAHGTARLDTKSLAKIRVPAAPIALQDQFVSRITEIELLRRRQQAHATALDALFASLQHRALRGEPLSQSST